jgi:hypothetical protein
LQKWVLGSDAVWHNVYTLQNGLSLGQQYSVDGLPSTLNPATTGLRNLSGRINDDGTVTLFALTSTASASGDPGADPNLLVSITDTLSFQSAADASAEQFTVLRRARAAEVLRGVSFVPLAAPTAVAGGDQSINVGQTVHLDGSGSFTSNTSSLGYAWTFASRPSASHALLSGASTSTPSFVADAPGSYVVQLVVTDPNTGLQSDPAFVEVSSLYIPPTAKAGVAQSGVDGTPVTLAGSGNDPNGLPLLGYAWSFASVPSGSSATLSNASTASASFTPDVAGTYTLALVVSDAFGSSDPATVDISVITKDDYAQEQLGAALNFVAAMPTSQFKAPGHRQSLSNLLQQAIAAIQAGDIELAQKKVNDALIRTDGYPVRGALDANGPSMDWVTNANAQESIYAALQNALSALM